MHQGTAARLPVSSAPGISQRLARHPVQSSELVPPAKLACHSAHLLGGHHSPRDEPGLPGFRFVNVAARRRLVFLHYAEVENGATNCNKPPKRTAGATTSFSNPESGLDSGLSRGV